MTTSPQDTCHEESCTFEKASVTDATDGEWIFPMRDTSLIFIDGLPGSGKSTTAELITARLQHHGFEADLLTECREGHPLNVGGELHPSGRTTGQEFFEHYTPTLLIAESLERWRQFAEEKQRVSTVTVAESYPFQNSIRILFQMNAPLDLVQEYEAQVEATISHLNPVLIYFDHSASTQSLQTVYEQRGPEWTSYFVSVVTRCAYAQARGLHGLDGVLTLIEDYQSLMNTIITQFPYPVHVLRECHGQWPRCHEQIAAFLGLP